MNEASSVLSFNKYNKAIKYHGYLIKHKANEY